MMLLSEGNAEPLKNRAVGESTETGTILHRILEGVEAKVGEQFFPSLVQQLATSLGVDYAYISELTDNGGRFRSKAGWSNGNPPPVRRAGPGPL